LDDQFYIQLRKDLISFFLNKGFSFAIGKNDEIDNFQLFFTFETETKKDQIITTIQSDENRDKFILIFNCRKKIKLIESFFSEEYLKLMEDTRLENYTINLLGEHLESQMVHYTESIKFDIPNFIHRIFTFIEEIVIPSLGKYSTIEELDLVVNRELKSASPIFATNFWFYKMVIAKLVDKQNFYNELFDYIIQSHEECFKVEQNEKEKQYYKNCLQVANQLHKDLENVLPMPTYLIN
jgi:hypothetical protein